MKISFHYNYRNFKVKNSGQTKEVIEKIASDSEKRCEEIHFVFTSDEEILRINNEFLSHNYYTDIITFDYSERDYISGEIYISVPTVKENAKIFRNSFSNEIERVILHGVLHLCGYKDSSEEEKILMRSLEDKYLALFK